MKHVIAKIVSILSYVLVSLLVILVGYLVYMQMTDKIPTLFGYSVMRIVSPSMTPKIPVGTFILIKEVDPATLQVNDIITFISKDPAISGLPNTHQIVGIAQSTNGPIFTTKGIANILADKETVAASDVIGKYLISLSALTWVGNIIHTGWVFLLLVLVPVLILFVFEIRNVIKASKSGGS